MPYTKSYMLYADNADKCLDKNAFSKRYLANMQPALYRRIMVILL